MGLKCILIVLVLFAVGVNTLGNRSVYYNGHAASVALVWGSEPAHAAAALLAVLLRYVRRYTDVHLLHAKHAIAELAVSGRVPLRVNSDYTELVIGVSTAWEPAAPQPWMQTESTAPGLAGPSLAEFGASSVPARCRLFAWLAPHARSDCHHQHMRWSFYANVTALTHCGFDDPATDHLVSGVVVLGVSECNATLQRLQARAKGAGTPVLPRLVQRADLMRATRTANHSFLFLDYDMWKGALGVSVVEPPPCASIDFDCKPGLDSTIAMRVADVDILQTYAPELFRFVYDFKPSLQTLRLILERQASGVDIEEAACEWALENHSYVISNNDRKKYDTYKYSVAIYLCLGDDDNRKYDEIIQLLGRLIHEQTFKVGCDLQFLRYYINCSDEYHMSNRLHYYSRLAGFHKLAGVVSMAVEGAVAASVEAANRRVPLMLADVVPEDDTAVASATWRVAGRPQHLALALLYFMREAGWTRLAILSQPTKLATDYYAALEDKAEISLRNIEIPPHLTEQQAQEVLQHLQARNIHIVFVNADSEAAFTILTAAAASRMGYEDGFVWIVREWRQNNVVIDTKHFTVSFRTWGVEDIPPAEGWDELQKKLSKQWPGHSWPPRAVSLADAILTLSIGFKDVFQKYPHMRTDLRNAETIRSLEESLIKTPVTGVNHLLRYKERSIEETFVFVDLWSDGKFEQRLATWRVNVTSGDVIGKNETRAYFQQPCNLPR